MPAKPSLAKFNNTLKKLARLLTKQAKGNVSAKWKLAFVDMRTPGNGSCIYKFRVELLNGTLLNQIETPDGLGELFVGLLEMREQLFDPAWWGIKITAFPNGRFKTEYNHNPNCVNDSSFFDFE